MQKENVLGKLLKGYRESAFPNEGLRRVAERVGIDYAHLFRIEAGQYTPTDDSLEKLVNTYNLDAEQKFEIFNLAKLSEKHLKIIRNASPKVVEAAFFRKSKQK